MAKEAMKRMFIRWPKNMEKKKKKKKVEKKSVYEDGPSLNAHIYIYEYNL